MVAFGGRVALGGSVGCLSPVHVFTFYRKAIIYESSTTIKLHLVPLPYYKNFTCRVSCILHKYVAIH